MKIVHVQYKTTAAFAAVNQQNIRNIVQELATLAHPGIQYSAWLLPDGQTFIHFDQFEDEAAHLALQALPSFKKFDEALWASKLEEAPVLHLLSKVAATGSMAIR